MKTEEAWIKSGNTKLYGKLHIPDSIPASALLVCHGLNVRGSQGLRIYTRLAQAACKAGFVPLTFDFRGVGRGSGTFDYGLGEQKDGRCALDYLASRSEASRNSIFVVGHSLGGAVSLYALRNETRVKGLALLSTQKNHNYNVRKFVKNTKGKLGLCAFLILSRIDNILNISKLFRLEVYGVSLRPRYVREKLMKMNEWEAASKLGVPLLIVIGSSDDIVGVDEAEEIYRSAHEPKTLIVIESADHIYRGKETELITRVIEWLKNVQSKETKSQSLIQP